MLFLKNNSYFVKKPTISIYLDKHNPNCVVISSYKKRYKGRQLKRSGDLCLLAGLPGDAILCYEESLESLRKVADDLWIAGLSTSKRIMSLIYY